MIISPEEKIDELLAKFRTLPLDKYPVDDIKDIIKKLGPFPSPFYSLSEGKRIVRARLNEENDSFAKKSDVNYLPQELNNSFQRASTPELTMFYGAVLPEELSPEEVQMERITAACETSKLWNKDTESIETETLTFSQWIVKNEIPLVAFIDPKNEGNNKTQLSQELYKMTHGLVNENPDLLRPTLKISKFFSDEFSKVVERGADDYNYIFTAILSNQIINGGAGGILYPSVQTEAKSINVAVSPVFVESSLTLHSVLECKMYKLGQESVVNNEKIVLNINNADSFEMEEIQDPTIKVPENEIIKHLENKYKSSTDS